MAWRAAISISALTMRPCGPEPLSEVRSRPNSRAKRRAKGEAKMRLGVIVPAVPPDLRGDLVQHLLGRTDRALSPLGEMALRAS